MFVCQYCNKPCGPKISPILITDPSEMRRVEYSNRGFDEDGNETINLTSGFEITKEYKSCPPCAGVEVKVEVPVDPSSFLLLTKSMHSHAASCTGFNKKTGEDCKLCKKNVEVFHSFPIQVLSRVLEQTPAKGIQSSLASMIVENMLDRASHGTKRAGADFKSAYPTLKNYEKAGGGL